MKIDLADVIKTINNSAEFCYSGDDINTIEWLNGTTPIDKQTILNKQIELQSEEDNKEIIKEQNKQSALNKLKALGLNDAEINSILGN
jgi:hypothetical protein